MAIKIQDKKIREQVQRDGRIICEVSFNPSDLSNYNKLLQLMDKISNADKEQKKQGKVNYIAKDKLQTIEDFEKYREDFDKIKNKISIYSELVKETKKDLDSIFGEGISDKITDGTEDLDLLMPLIKWAMPYFQKERKKKVEKYTIGSKKYEHSNR